MKSITSKTFVLGLAFLLWVTIIDGSKHSGIHISDGVLKLIIRSYVDDILSNFPTDNNLRQKLSRMSNHVTNHPALYQKRLFVGVEPPQFDPDEPGHGNPHNPHIPRSFSLTKRLVPAEKVVTPSEQFPSEEICPTNRQWEQINKTHDLNDNEVEVVQQEGMTQFIYTYRCSPLQAESSCVGISPLYKSECTERYGWVYMLHKKPGDEQAQWGYVAAPHHCACKIQPRLEEVATVSEAEPRPAPVE